MSEQFRSALESIAGWRKVNLSSEYEHGLRDIIRSMTDCAAAALDAAPQPAVPAQGQPNLKQIEAAIDDHLGNIDATYEDSRRRCAQSILNLYAVPSTTCATPSCPEPRYVDPVNACDDRSTIGAKSQAHGCKRPQRTDPPNE